MVASGSPKVSNSFVSHVAVHVSPVGLLVSNSFVSPSANSFVSFVSLSEWWRLALPMSPTNLNGFLIYQLVCLPVGLVAGGARLS